VVRRSFRLVVTFLLNCASLLEICERNVKKTEIIVGVCNLKKIRWSNVIDTLRFRETLFLKLNFPETLLSRDGNKTGTGRDYASPKRIQCNIRSAPIWQYIYRRWIIAFNKRDRVPDRRGRRQPVRDQEQISFFWRATAYVGNEIGLNDENRTIGRNWKKQSTCVGTGTESPVFITGDNLFETIDIGVR